VPMEGIGKNVQTLAHSYHDVQAEADNLLDHLQPSFILLLDEIAKKAEIVLKRRFRITQYVGAGLQQEGLGVTLHFAPDKFLCLSLSADHRCYDKVPKELLDKFTADRSYTMTSGILSKSFQLPEANSQDEAIQQIEQGAAFLAGELGAWSTLVNVGDQSSPGR